MHAGVRVTYGDFEGTVASLEETVPALLQAVQNPDVEWGMPQSLGLALTHVGRHQDAAIWLVRALQSRLKDRPTHPWNLVGYFYVADNLRMSGQVAEARSVVEAGARHIAPLRGIGEKNAQRHRYMLEWMRARLLLDEGQHAEALHALRTYPAQLDENIWDIANYQGDVGEALCAAGNPGLGLTHLLDGIQRKIAFYENLHAPWIMRMQALAAMCARDAGKLVVARELAVLARATLARHSVLSAYYTRPVLALEDGFVGLR